MRYDAEHARDVAAPTACHLIERLRGDLAAAGDAELHREVALVVETAIRSYFEFGGRGGDAPAPSRN